MSKEKNGEVESFGRRAMLGLDFELLHSILRLPPAVRIVQVLDDSMFVNLIVEGGELPEQFAGCPIPVVEPIYEHAQAVRFIRFERIDDERQDPQPQPA